MKFQYHKDGTTPTINTVFVFGSNLAGNHGAGSALVAHQTFNAVWGRRQGWTSMYSYGIPTKEFDIRTSRSLRAIKTAVDEFVAQTWQNPNLRFFITRIGCGLAGYKDAEIAPLFANCNPANCSFAFEWAEFLEPQLKPLLKKRGNNQETLDFIRGQTATLFATIEEEIRACIDANRERTKFIITEEVPKTKEAIRTLGKSLEILRMVTNLRDEESDSQSQVVSIIQTLNKVRRSQSDELNQLREMQVFNKTALNTLMRERERVFPTVKE